MALPPSPVQAVSAAASPVQRLRSLLAGGSNQITSQAPGSGLPGGFHIPQYHAPVGSSPLDALRAAANPSAPLAGLGTQHYAPAEMQHLLGHNAEAVPLWEQHHPLAMRTGKNIPAWVRNGMHNAQAS